MLINVPLTARQCKLGDQLSWSTTQCWTVCWQLPNQ